MRKEQYGSEVYGYICEYAQMHGGNSPGYRTIAEALGISSTSTVAYQIKRLIDAGHLERKDGHVCVVGAEWIVRSSNG